MKTLSIIIPIFNEEKTVKEIIKRVVGVSLPKKITKEIIAIDDGSTDKTAKILSEIKFPNLKLKIIRHQKNLGKGAAVIAGLKQASGDYIIIQDADLEYNPEDYRKLLGPILSKKTEVVYGTRLVNFPFKLFGKEKTILPAHLLGNKFLTFTTNLLFGSHLTDMETCYKLFTKKVNLKLNLKSNRFEIEPEITAKILKNNFSIMEVPIKVTPRTHKDGKKISWRDGFKALKALIKYRLYD